MSLRPGWLACILVAGLLSTLPRFASAEDPPAKETPEPAKAADQKPEPLVLEERPEKLDAPRSEAEKDRIHAATLFAQGRILNQRGKHAEALAKFERAWRYDQESKTILEELVPLAVRLNRLDEAARYAVIAIEKGFDLDPRTLQRLAMHLSQNQDWENALTVYDELYRLQKDGEESQPDISTILIQLERGRIHFLLGDYKQSAEAFAVVWDALQSPDKYNLNDALQKMVLDEPGRTYLLLGESFVRGGRPDDAEAVFRKADEANPQPELLTFRLARVAAARDKTDEALEQLDKYFEAKSSVAGIDAYELLAELLSKKHGEQEGKQQLVERLEKLYADDPGNADLAAFTAERFVEADRLEDAEKIYREQLALNPSPTVHRGLIEVSRRSDQPEKLLEALGQAAAESGSLDAYEDEVAEIAENEQLLNRLIERASEKKKARGADGLAEGMALAVGLVAMQGEKFDAAHEFFELAAKHEDDNVAAAVLTAWGLQSFFAGQYEKAAEIFQRAIDEQVNPENDAAFYFYRANALAFADRPDEALAAAVQAAQLRPENPRFESRVAWINYRAHRHGEAERRYLELLDKIGDDYSSDDMRQLVREAKLILSNIHIQQDRFEDGVERLEQVLDEFPRDPGALNDLGYLWAEKGVHLDRSLRMIQQAVETEPENAAYQDSLGWALHRLGRHEEALTHLQKAVELQGEDVDGVILDHLGDVYLELNQKDKALDAWRRAATAFEKADDPESLEQVRKKIAE